MILFFPHSESRVSASLQLTKNLLIFAAVNAPFLPEKGKVRAFNEILQRYDTQLSCPQIRENSSLIEKGYAAVGKEKLHDGIHAVDFCDARKGGQGNVVQIQRFLQNVSGARAGFAQQKRFREGNLACATAVPAMTAFRTVFRRKHGRLNRLQRNLLC